jgi:uncharacterized sulfatase
VLFLIADDLNTAMGCYGHSLVKTPNVDRLAASGVRFDRTYCQFPLCGPSRASMLTGLRPPSTKVDGNNIDFRDFHPEIVTLPQMFRRAGIFSGRVGKLYHMNVPGEVGTDRFQDAPSWDYALSPKGLENKSEGPRNRLSGSQQGMTWIAPPNDQGQADTNAADTALALLERHRKDRFFLGVGFLRPHLPFVAPSKFFDMYPLSAIPAPQVPNGDLADVPRAHQQVRPWLWHQMGMTEAQQREALRGYYASTSYMDEQAGRVLDGLERMGLAKDTVVLFVGDHGWNLGEHTRWQKMSLFEESARVPLVVRAPGMRGNGKASSALIEMVDFYPTLAELCGLQAPDHVQGQSFVPVLQDPTRRWKKAAFTELQFENRIAGRSIRTDRYRYIRWEGEGGGEELYDHDMDPAEHNNLAQDPNHSRAMKEMRTILDAGWQKARA